MNIIKSILLGFSTGILGCIIHNEIDFSSHIYTTNTDNAYHIEDDNICNVQISESILNEDYFFEENNEEMNEIPLKIENPNIRSL